MRIWTKQGSALVGLAFAALTGLAAFSCVPTGGPPVVPVNPALIIDSDPLGLFPGGVVAIGNLDSRAFYGSGSTAAQVAGLFESTIPLGQEMGFVASRDVDRMVVGFYAGAAIDAVAVLSGRFDLAHMQAAANAHAPTHAGGTWTALPYAGRTLYTATNLAVAPLTDHTVLAGSESAVRRLLDRLAQGGAQPRTGRELADWMLQAIDAPGAAFALAADIGGIPPAALHGMPIPSAMAGLTRVAVIGDFHPPGLNVASTLSYGDPPHAALGAEALRQVGAVADVAGKLGAGPRIQNLSIGAEGPNVACKFALDDEAMRRTLASVLRVFAPAGARPPG